MTGKLCLRAALAAVLVAIVCCGQEVQAINWPDCDGCAECDNPFFSPDCGVRKPVCRAQYYNWNRNYSHVNYGQPVALVVPPTANLQTNWGWGVSSSRLSRLDHQFHRNYPGYGAFGGPNRPTPAWPSDTNQFGVYYVRGPW